MSKLKKITPEHDPWEAYNDIKQYGKPCLQTSNSRQQPYVICAVSIVQ